MTTPSLSDLASGLNELLNRTTQLLLGRFLAPAQEYAVETAAGAPGAGRFRLNGPPSAATEIYLDLADLGGAALAGLIDTWDDSTSTVRGVLRLGGATDASKWALFEVLGVTAPAGYRRLSVRFVAGSAPAWAAGDRFTLDFHRSGDRGEVGAVGPGYAATSATALAVGTGSRSLTTQAGLAYAVGSRVRLARTAAPTTWMEGIVTAYTVGTGAMTVAVDRVSGTGSHSDWTISIAGQGALDAAAADAAAAAAIAARDAAAGHAADADADRIAAQAARSGAEAAASAASASAADADADRIAAQAARVGAEAARDQAQQIVGGPYQLQDATLTAFASLNFSAANAFLRATGPDAFVVETAAQMRASLGATTVGSALFTLANPGSIRFLRINADNTVTALNAADTRTALGLGSMAQVNTTIDNNLYPTLVITNSAGSVNLRLNCTLGNQRVIEFTTGGVPRWIFRANSSAETGANAGSDLDFSPRDDTGALIPNAGTIIRRSDGRWTFPAAAAHQIGSNAILHAGMVGPGLQFAGGVLSTGSVPISAETTGTLTTASANRQVQATGPITIPSGVFAAGALILIDAGDASRTITQGAGLTLRLGGTTATGNRTLAAHGLAIVRFRSGAEAVIQGGSALT